MFCYSISYINNNCKLNIKDCIILNIYFIIEILKIMKNDEKISLMFLVGTNKSNYNKNNLNEQIIDLTIRNNYEINENIFNLHKKINEENIKNDLIMISKEKFKNIDVFEEFINNKISNSNILTGNRYEISKNNITILSIFNKKISTIEKYNKKLIKYFENLKKQ